MANRISIGVEIECITDTDYFDGDIGDYHQGVPIAGMPGWRAESDGSLRIPDDDCYDEWTTVEFVSGRCRGFGELKTTLGAFKEYYQARLKTRNNGEIDDLYQCLEFNGSCGAHIHLSMSDIVFHRYGLWPAFVKLRSEFFDRLRVSSIISKQRILTHYNREYAQAVQKDIRHQTQKYREFNIGSEIEGRGLEWRSPNMWGIRTWTEFDEYWDIVIECLKHFCENVLECTEEDEVSEEYPHRMILLENYPENMTIDRLEDFFYDIHLHNIPQFARTNSRIVLSAPERIAYSSETEVICEPCTMSPEIEEVDAKTDEEEHCYVQPEYSSTEERCTQEDSRDSPRLYDGGGFHELSQQR